MESPRPTVRPLRVRSDPMAPLIAQVLLFGALAARLGAGPVGLSPSGWAVAVACEAIMVATLARRLSGHRAERLGAAGWVTLARATLAIGVAAVTAQSFHEAVPIALLVSLAALALALDAVDGWVARRTTDDGARARGSTPKSTPS